jgi:hypothetical protein
MDLRAKVRHRAAEFFDEHGEHSKADRERELADREARDAETELRHLVTARCWIFLPNWPRELGHSYIGVEHLFLAIVRPGFRSCVARRSTNLVFDVRECARSWMDGVYLGGLFPLVSCLRPG